MLSPLRPNRHAQHHSQADQWAEGGQGKEESRGEGEDESGQRLPGQLQCCCGLRCVTSCPTASQTSSCSYLCISFHQFHATLVGKRVYPQIRSTKQSLYGHGILKWLFPGLEKFLCVSIFRFEVPVQASAFHPSQTSVTEGSRDEWQVDGVVWCGSFSQNHQCARLPPVPQAASRYDQLECNVKTQADIWQLDIDVFWASYSNWATTFVCMHRGHFFVQFPSPLLQVSPYHLRWPWLSYSHSCTTASCPRAISLSTWRSNWAPRSSLTPVFPKPTPSRGCALRKVPTIIFQWFLLAKIHNSDILHRPTTVSCSVDGYPQFISGYQIDLQRSSRHCCFLLRFVFTLNFISDSTCSHIIWADGWLIDWSVLAGVVLHHQWLTPRYSPYWAWGRILVDVTESWWDAHCGNLY